MMHCGMGPSNSLVVRINCKKNQVRNIVQVIQDARDIVQVIQLVRDGNHYVLGLGLEIGARQCP